jgi:hypothetical protein
MTAKFVQIQQQHLQPLVVQVELSHGQGQQSAEVQLVQASISTDKLRVHIHIQLLVKLQATEKNVRLLTMLL